VFVTGFPAGAWGTNCYVVATAEGEDCLVVDPGQDSLEPLADVLREHRLRPVAVLLTHGHVDHVWSVAPVAAEFAIPAYCHADDAYRLADPAGTSIAATREALLAMTKGELELTEPADLRLLHDGERCELAGIDLLVRHAPGHTEGSVVFQHDDPEEGFMLSGDLLFAGSIGRTDLPGGDPEKMARSLLRVIGQAPAEMTVLPGHGPVTSVGVERATNPFLTHLGLNEAPDSMNPRRGL